MWRWVVVIFPTHADSVAVAYFLADEADYWNSRYSDRVISADVAMQQSLSFLLGGDGSHQVGLRSALAKLPHIDRRSS
ncbi:MAG: hypothetical protein KJ749_15700 [Planctomycetes bacterium]|nr:hypothetical protein [Planctomycetota bacterium]